MLRHLFCEKCSIQFGKKYVFDLHLSLVHGEKIEIKSEPLGFVENLQGIQISEKEFSNQVKNEQPIYEENFEELEVKNETLSNETFQNNQMNKKNCQRYQWTNIFDVIIAIIHLRQNET